MVNLPGVVVAGACGRMGQMLIEVVGQSSAVRLVAALERQGHPMLGQLVGSSTLTSNMEDALASADVLIDFTTPDTSLELADAAAKRGCVHVIGTTGFSPEQRAALEDHARRNVIICASNMSLGINLLVGLTRQVAAALDADFDIEIVEAHHRHKVDAPSGTALMLGEAAAWARNVSLTEVADRGRDGVTGARGSGRIGFAAVRGGDVVGEHDVVFAGEGERIVLRHIATDRAIYARGALKAALWGIGRAPGLFGMANVLGLADG